MNEWIKVKWILMCDIVTPLSKYYYTLDAFLACRALHLQEQHPHNVRGMEMRTPIELSFRECGQLMPKIPSKCISHNNRWSWWCFAAYMQRCVLQRQLKTKMLSAETRPRVRFCWCSKISVSKQQQQFINKAPYWENVLCARVLTCKVLSLCAAAGQAEWRLYRWMD